VISRDRLSVLHVIAPGDVGGAERVVHTLATGQHRAGHQVRVVAVLANGADRHPFLVPLDKAGLETIPLRVPPRAYGRERTAIEELCRRLRPDVMHTHGYHVDVVDAGAARRAGVRTVTTVHGFTGGDWKNWIYERLQRRAFRRFDAVVAVSRPLARDLERTGVPSALVHVVPNAWPATDPPPLPRDQARAQLAVPVGRFHVGWVGRLTPEKGADVLLAALARLTDLPVVASVVGDGPRRPALEQLAARLGLGDRVRWLGNVAEAARLFAAFDVFALSSRTEGTPIVLFEAMAACTPIVASAVGGVPDVVSPAEALLVTADDPAALAQAIRSVHADPAAAAHRARLAHERLASEFAPGPWLERYERIYRSAG
jgi:glycosyltransferase involved in cell wall biosynthesis